jgi:hypothetical protein
VGFLQKKRGEPPPPLPFFIAFLVVSLSLNKDEEPKDTTKTFSKTISNI